MTFTLFNRAEPTRHKTLRLEVRTDGEDGSECLSED